MRIKCVLGLSTANSFWPYIIEAFKVTFVCTGKFIFGDKAVIDNIHIRSNEIYRWCLDLWKRNISIN